MINNEELPIGFTMELAQHSDALVRFSGMTKDEQQTIISLFRSHRDLPNTLSNTKIQIPATRTDNII